MDADREQNKKAACETHTASTRTIPAWAAGEERACKASRGMATIKTRGATAAPATTMPTSASVNGRSLPSFGPEQLARPVAEKVGKVQP